LLLVRLPIHRKGVDGVAEGVGAGTALIILDDEVPVNDEVPVDDEVPVGEDAIAFDDSGAKG